MILSRASILGVDDGAFPPFAKIKKIKFKTLLVGALVRRLKLRWVGIEKITVDGLDSTSALLKIIERAPIVPDFIMMSGLTFAGFNVIDVKEIHSQTGIPIIIVVDRMPNFTSIREALIKHFSDWKRRWKLLTTLTPLNQMHVKRAKNPLYYEYMGISKESARKLIEENCIDGKIPEPIRIASMIASSLSKALNLTGSEDSLT